VQQPVLVRDCLLVDLIARVQDVEVLVDLGRGRVPRWVVEEGLVLEERVVAPQALVVAADEVLNAAGVVRVPEDLVEIRRRGVANEVDPAGPCRVRRCGRRSRPEQGDERDAEQGSGSRVGCDPRGDPRIVVMAGADY
jgi:hypothetical protein